MLCACLSFLSAAWAQKVGLLMDSYVIERWRTDQNLIV